MIEASTIQVPPARMWFMERIRYWQKVDDDDHRTQRHKAIEQLEWNAGILGVSGGAVTNMRTAMSFSLSADTTAAEAKTLIRTWS